MSDDLIVLLKKTSSLPIGNDIIQVFLFSKDKTPSISKSLKFHNIFQSGMVLQVKTENHSRAQAGVAVRLWGHGQPDSGAVLNLQCKGAGRKVCNLRLYLG